MVLMNFKKLNFRSDEVLRNQYVSHLGNVRFGLLLEYLDLMAGETALNYLKENNELASTVVTAAIDEINLCKPIRADTNVRFSGEVINVGKTSLDVLINVFADNEKDKGFSASCHFVMVAMSDNLKPLEIKKKYCPFFEWQKVRMGTIAKKRKEYNDFFENENSLIKLFKDSDELIEGVLMNDTVLKNNFVMFPQQQNIHGKMFGGYLMRLAYELSWITALKYGTKEFNQVPLPVRVDKINFYKPVEIGDVLELTSCVCYVGKTSLQVEVDVKKTNSKIDNFVVTNSCIFTFVMRDLNGSPKILPKLNPSSFQEFKKVYLAEERIKRIKK